MTKKDLPSPELLRKLLRYDPGTGKLFWKDRPVDMFKTERASKMWNSRFPQKEAFTATNGGGYKVGDILYKTLRAHRVAWTIYYGEWPLKEIDHINGDKEDNRIENLRDVEGAVNKRNRPMMSNNKSGHNGVRWCKRTRKWWASITLNGNVRHIGRFEKIEDAIAARKQSEIDQCFTERHGL